MVILPRGAWDRRTFLRRMGAAGLAAPVIALLACGDESGSEGEGAAPEALRRITDPVLRAFADDAVHVVAPMSDSPIAYISQRPRRIFVDLDFRDRAVGVLAAHISVSTGHWRIPQPGDPLTEPLTPGVPEREFEELRIDEWDVDMEPGEGDVRIRLGRASDVALDFACTPMEGQPFSCSGGLWLIRQCDGSSAGTCREDFVEVGVGTRHPRSECTDAGASARFLTWMCPDR